MNEDRVVVSVEVRGERSENDCLMGVGVTLAAPLGDRELIDRTTRDPVPLERFADVPEDSGNSS